MVAEKGSRQEKERKQILEMRGSRAIKCKLRSSADSFRMYLESVPMAAPYGDGGIPKLITRYSQIGWASD